MLILITGSRYWEKKDIDIISDELLSYNREPVVLMHGACPYGSPTDSPYKGVDGHAHALAESWGWEVLTFPPKPLNGRIQARSFAIRNQVMVDKLPDLTLGFLIAGLENKGTNMTLGMAKRRKLPITTITLEKD